MGKKSPSLNLTQALGHDIADKRIDILRRLGEVGSISEAARAAGVSYKAAWQAIETLSNLAGSPLVEKVVGGSGGGGAQLTEAGQRVLAGAHALAQARANVLKKFERLSNSSMSSASLTGLGLRTSMRNHLPCQVKSIKKHETTVRVLLDLGGNNMLAARITQESVQLLGLRTGMQVLALCKATAVTMAQQHTPREGSNVIQGQVTRIANTQRGGELSIQLTSGQQLVGFAQAQHGLKVGMTVSAMVQESGVVIAVAS